jgi:cytochrome c biogenesis protein CcmG/thiol:disulfide interchange protein DsbE
MPRSPSSPISFYKNGERLGGDGIHLYDVLANGKPVVLNFWAAGCSGCIKEMPDLQALSEAYGDDVTLIGIDLGAQVDLGSPEAARILLGKVNVTYPTGTTPDRIKAGYKVFGMPRTVFLLPSGEISAEWSGVLSPERMRSLTQDLIKAAATGS